MTNRKPPRASLEDELDHLADNDSDVREAADRLDWMAQKAAMGWPQPKRIRKAPSGISEEQR